MPRCGPSLPPSGRGNQSRDFTYVGDIVDATLATMSRAPAGHVYNIGGGAEVSMRDALQLCERIVGRPLDVRLGPAAVGDARRTIADVSLAALELDWRPTTSLEEGLAAQAGEAVVERSEPPLPLAEFA